MSFTACATGEADADSAPAAQVPDSAEAGAGDEDSGKVVTPPDAQTCGSDVKPGCACPQSGQQVACWTGPVNQRNVGSCRDGKMTCNGGVFGDCVGQVIDCGSADAASDTSSGPQCHDGGVGGIGMPAGSTASSAQTGGAAYVATNAIDGNPNTMWNAGQNTGTLTVNFVPTQITAVKILSAAQNAGDVVTMSVTGKASGTTVGTGSAQHTTTAPSESFVMNVALTPGTYDSLEIQANYNNGWVGIFEVGLATSACP